MDWASHNEKGYPEEKYPERKRPGMFSTTLISVTAWCNPSRKYVLAFLFDACCQRLLQQQSVTYSAQSTAVQGDWFNLLKPPGYVIHQQFNIQQLYVLPTLYLCVLYLSDNKQRLVPLNSINWSVFITEMKSVYCAARTGSLNKAVCASYLKG